MKTISELDVSYSLQRELRKLEIAVNIRLAGFITIQ
jgi:hypothetical protein